MSNCILAYNHKEEHNSNTKVNKYHFNSSFIYDTLNKSHSKKSIMDQSLNINQPNKIHFNYKELEPKDLFNHHKLLHSKSTKSISTSATITNDQSVIVHKPMIKPNNSYINLNQPVTPLIIESTKRDIHKRTSTLNEWVKHVEKKGFNKYKEVIHKKTKKRQLIMNSNRGITTYIKATKKDSNALYLSNGRISLETMTYKQRALSQRNQRINPNQIVSIKVELPKYNPKAIRLNKQTEKMSNQSKKIQKETILLQNAIKATTVEISRQEKENETIIKELLLYKKKITSIKEKIDFCFDANNKYMHNVYQLVNNQSLYLNDQ